jgi:hypothetical protein
MNGENSEPLPRPAPPSYLRLGPVLALAAIGATAGLALRLAIPVGPPDAALVQRLEAWKANAPELERNHHRGVTRRP